MNKLKIFLTWVLLSTATHALGINVSVDPISIEAGKTAQLIINLSNTETNLTAYQMSLYLPEGVTVQKKANGKYAYTANSDRHDGAFTISVKDAADGSVLIACFSADKDVLVGNSGELLRLPLEVASTVTTPQQASLKNIEFSDVNANAYHPSDVTFSLTMATSVEPDTPTGYKLYPAEFSIRKGESETMSINLENEQGIIMAEFYMQLPEGITIATDGDGYLNAVLNDGRTDRTHLLEVELGSDGLYHFLAYSNKNKPFTGNEGELIYVTLNCDESVEAGEYQGTLKSILLSDADKQAIQTADLTFAIEVTDYIPGDVNDDRRINGMDIVEMVELIMSQGYSKAADLYPVGQPDGKVNGMDLVEEVELVMSQPAQQAAQLRMANSQFTENNSSLKRGVYVVNGHKVVVK